MQYTKKNLTKRALTGPKTILIRSRDGRRVEKKLDIAETGLISQELLLYNAMLPARSPQREKHPTICSFRENSHQFRVYRRRRYICLKWDFSIASNLRFKCYGRDAAGGETPGSWIGSAINPRVLTVHAMYFGFFNGAHLFVMKVE